MAEAAVDALTAARHRRDAASTRSSATARLATETEKARDRFVKHKHLASTMHEWMGTIVRYKDA